MKMCDAHTVRSAVLIVLVIWCTVSDLRTGRIPNKVLAAGIVAAFFLTAAAGGAAALKGMLAGSCFPMILFPLFCLRMIGAGDIKLLAAVSAFIPEENYLRCLAGAFLIGAAAGIIKIAVTKGKEHTVHFAVPVALSVMLYLTGVYS
jgi:prepilin peptidase CpaA